MTARRPGLRPWPAEDLQAFADGLELMERRVVNALARQRRRSPLARLAAWRRRLDTACRLVAFGSTAVAGELHEPLPDPAHPETCTVDGLPLDHPLHGGGTAAGASQ